MKDFKEKLIARLEEEVEYQGKKADEADVFEEVSVSHTRISIRKCYEHAIEIVNNLAEETADEYVKLPCKIGDTLYFIENGEVFPFVAYSFDIRALQKFVRDYNGMSLNFAQFGKTVFKTKAEAEEKLKEIEW